jgi:hypothetical protein
MSNGLSLTPLLLGEPPSVAISACVAGATAALKLGLVDAPRIDWSHLGADLAEKITGMFDIDLIDVVVSAWHDFRELQDCADPAKHAADETISLPLIDHVVDSKLQPYLDVAVGARPPIRINFEIALELELHGVNLKIQNAMIHALRIGSCRGGAKVTCEGVEVIERRTRLVELPGEIDFPQGIPIEPSFAPHVSRVDPGPALRPGRAAGSGAGARDVVRTLPRRG